MNKCIADKVLTRMYNAFQQGDTLQVVKCRAILTAWGKLHLYKEMRELFFPGN